MHWLKSWYWLGFKAVHGEHHNVNYRLTASCAFRFPRLLREDYASM